MNYHYHCEATAPGQPSHTFPTVDHATAAAMCAANGWDLIRVYAPGSASDIPATAPPKGDGPLSRKQRTCLVTEASKTFKMLAALGLATGTFDTWRHEQVQAAVRRPGLSACQNSHYKKLLAHFRSLRGGPADPAPARPWSREGGDTHERREQLLRSLDHELGAHARRIQRPESPAEAALAATAATKGGVITEAYLLTIARAKNPSAPLQDIGCLITLTAAKLEQLLFTLRNRIAAREGRGDSAKRNKH